MSGGVGPTCKDIRLPKEEEEEDDERHHHHLEGIPENESNKKLKKSSKKRYLTFRQLNALAVILVFSASGMVSIEDFSFVLFSFFYMLFISKVAFPSLSSTPEPPVFGHNNKILSLYVSLAALVGLFLPIAYIFEGILTGDKEGIKAASPHVFLLGSQVFLEGVSVHGDFSLPVRVFVPVLYNSRRIFTLVEWLRTEIRKGDGDFGGIVRRLHVGRGLAIINLVLWCYNLFGFLLPVYLPRAFKRYYSEHHKVKD